MLLSAAVKGLAAPHREGAKLGRGAMIDVADSRRNRRGFQQLASNNLLNSLTLLR
jgi:hypothetical protein